MLMHTNFFVDTSQLSDLVYILVKKRLCI